MTRQEMFELAIEAKTGTPAAKIKAERCQYGVYTTIVLREAYYWYNLGFWKGFFECEERVLKGVYKPDPVRQGQSIDIVV